MNIQIGITHKHTLCITRGYNLYYNLETHSVSTYSMFWNVVIQRGNCNTTVRTTKNYMWSVWFMLCSERRGNILYYYTTYYTRKGPVFSDFGLSSRNIDLFFSKKPYNIAIWGQNSYWVEKNGSNSFNKIYDPITYTNNDYKTEVNIKQPCFK